MLYTVKSGDTVYKLSKRFGVPMSRITIDNGLSDPDRLVVGQNLLILTPHIVYTVKTGDTLYSIAKRFGTTVTRLWQNNPDLRGLDTVYPQQTLVISYTPSAPLGEISVNGYAYPYIDSDTLRATLPYLTYLSVFSYGITSSGGLIPLQNDSRVIKLCRDYGTVSLMVLSSLGEDGNFSNERVGKILSDKEASQNLIEEAVQTVRQKGYGGIDVDFEYIPSFLAGAYAQFLRLMKERLGKELVLFASLAPKNDPMMKGLLYEGHDYGAVGAASDKVLLMTYEWGYTYGPPMAVSPVNKVREVVDYAVSVIPSKKIFLGIPNYSYDWALPYIRGKSAADSLSNEEATALAKEKGADIRFDEVSQAPFFEYYDVPSGTDPVLHKVWTQNARSVDAMLNLAKEFHLDGVSVWNVMKYFPALWSVLNSRCKIRKLVPTV